MAYHMLTAPPAPRETVLAVGAPKHVKDTPVSPIVHRPEILPSFERLVRKLMEKNPDRTATNRPPRCSATWRRSTRH